MKQNVQFIEHHHHHNHFVSLRVCRTETQYPLLYRRPSKLLAMRGRAPPPDTLLEVSFHSLTGSVFHVAVVAVLRLTKYYTIVWNVLVYEASAVILLAGNAGCFCF